MEFDEVNEMLTAYERQRNDNFEAARITAYYSILPHIPEASRPDSIIDFFPLPFDDESKPQTDETVDLSLYKKLATK